MPYEGVSAQRADRGRLSSMALSCVIWRVLDRAVDWLVLRDGQYERLVPDEEGLLRSEIFPGLWLDVPALLRGDVAGVLAAVQRGLTSPEHNAFVVRLSHAPSDQ